MQKGSINEFIDKENKWFNYIKGYEHSGYGDVVDTGQFSSQGLGFAASNTGGGRGGCDTLIDRVTKPLYDAADDGYFYSVEDNTKCVSGQPNGQLSAWFKVPNWLQGDTISWSLTPNPGSASIMSETGIITEEVVITSNTLYSNTYSPQSFLVDIQHYQQGGIACKHDFTFQIGCNPDE